ncbi:MAG: hypothetical protein ACSLFQ_03515 [Thermoanaerobaculia bacterium]
MTVFYISTGMPAEAVLFVGSIVRALDGVVPLSILEEEPVDLVERDPALAKLREDAAGEARASSRVVIWEGCEPPSGVRFGECWNLGPVGDGSGELRLDSPRGRHRFPFVISPDIVKAGDRLDSDRPRILVPLSPGDARRERMTLRALEELRRRAWPHLLVAVGAAPADLLRSLAPDEWYAEPTACELGALLMSSSAVLDLSDESVPPSIVARLARCLGTRVVLHESSSLARPFSPEVRAAQEWSPDAFCDLITSLPVGADQELPWGMEFEAIAEDLGRILTLG